ncbi:N-6 DNA methylase [Planctomycetes bacterium TBK1r]|uniref:site-specific DNA-methyltransferase (adenine-specific) n=1 Tax=Stieleria magnilauensis TaxID=2527963 RepID=A0ABX5XH95_9BACT|nr:N-6 DNA Methylase [Planctomycetes bacterium TBK1r]
MANEQYLIAGSKGIVELFDKASNQSGLSRGQVFEDFVTLSRCALSGQTAEEEYLSIIAKGYDKGTMPERGADTLKTAFHTMVDVMAETGEDVLGDIFTGAITYGERGQFFTPASVCDLMGALTIPTERTPDRKSVCDPACGSGRMLLSVARHQPHWEFTGQDVDHRAAQMTAINLGLNGLRGWAVWQNTLTLQCHRVYRIGMNWSTGGVITEVPVEQSPFNYHPVPKETSKSVSQSRHAADNPDDHEPAGWPPSPDDDSPPPSQLDLF